MATVKNTEVLYREYNEVAPIGLIAMRGTEELAARINNYLIRWADRNGRPHEEFLIENECPRFASGDAKGLIKSTVRGKDLFILIDVGNYSCSYKFFDKENHMSPDDHYADLKRIIQAASGKPHRINVIMPLLYGGRQHRRSYRESLDCAFMLQELRDMGVQNVITVDAHDPRVCNAIPLMGFDNVIPSYQVLKSMFGAFPDLVIDKDHFMVISPDEGALARNMFYASVLEVEMGMFYKRRDYATIVNGRNPIVAHEYLGTDVKGKTVFVADDIISSGESMLDIARELKKREAKRFFAYATYGIFTNGLEAFDKAYDEGMIDAVFSTNLTYRTPELLKRPWYKEVDVSKYIAYFIACINHDTSISNVIDPHEKIKALLREHRGL
ncbi:MAG: ribose-phosphate pyrophosphokinase [Lachnospiraceae bacterium]|nr:ribose-phosphate pyrophosphokinase [Ruminococcus sp.]MCM1274109.1 ribose-phosphate pyrophosphokinase [Lachnospiraceae bacterium]